MSMNTMLPPTRQKLSLWQRITGKSYAPWQVFVGPFVLGVASLAFSLYSANAIRWVFSGLGVTDKLESIMVWVIAGAFGVTGYFITRGLAYRMMNKQRIRGYIFICFLVEMVEISCNLLEALVAMQHSTQFDGFVAGVHTALTVLVCVMWSCVPLIQIGLAILEMDMEREKRGLTATGQPKVTAPSGVAPSFTRSQTSFGTPAAINYPSMPQSGYGPVATPPLAGAGRHP